MDLSIRDFIKEDKEFYLKASLSFYSSPAVTKPLKEAMLLLNFNRTFDECIKGSPFVQGLIFESEGKKAGFALLSFTYSNEVGGLSVLLEELYILPDFQSMGIGTKFLAMIEENYVTTGKAKRIRLEVEKMNKGAMALYEKIGYKKLSYIQMVKDFL